MNGSKGNAAFNASEMPERREIVLNLNTAYRMLPLVQRVANDIVANQKTINRLHPEQERLDRHRRDLVWLERQRRYQVHEEIDRAEAHLRSAVEELHELGLALLEPESGRIGFPTMVNDRRAFFCWQPGEETLRSWLFAEETTCRPIPPAWWKVAEASLSGKN
jgi:hypothetical protein